VIEGLFYLGAHLTILRVDLRVRKVPSKPEREKSFQRMPRCNLRQNALANSG
jgi:hypothetical protein